MEHHIRISMWKTKFILLLVIFAVNGKPKKKRVCVVGAGVSGLVAAKYFSKYPDEFQTVVFEKNSNVGGLWIYTDSTTIDEHGLPVHSSAYKNLRTNTEQNTMIFPDYPQLGDEASKGRFLKHEIILEYLRNYTEHFNLRQYITFNTNVEKIEPLSQLRWIIAWRNLNNNKTSNTICDAVLVCNGHNFKESIPKIPGIESFNGKVLHSHAYRKPEAFANQTVVVLGAGNSGTDIGIDISSVTEKVYLSHRHDKLSGEFPSNLEQVPGVVGAEDGKLILSNGTKISADALIFCTGYVFDYPFLDESSGIVIEEGGKYVRPVYKHMINIERPTMAFVDLAVVGSHFSTVHAHVNYYRAVLRGQVNLPSREQMLLEVEKSLNESLRKGHVTSLNEFLKYYNELVLEANGKPLPWWFGQYTAKRRKLFSTDRLHCRDKRLVIHENNRTVEFV